MLKAVLFDLDGTLLPLNDEEFTKAYFKLLCQKVLPLGYSKDEFVNAIWAGTAKMIKNDGSKTNEEVFWECFKNIYGEEKLKDKPHFDDFYLNEFRLTKSICEENPHAKEIVKFIKDNNLKVILSTNPLFPKDGILTRMSFVNLEESDFDYITSYENSHFSKPNPKYFAEILEKNNLKADEVILFGNNEIDDCECAGGVNIKSYLVGNHLILKNENPPYPHIKMNEIIDIIKSEM